MPSPPPSTISEEIGRRSRVERASRSDGSTTRAHILETAGELYAEGGYSRTTIKAICLQASTNMAAVNYHFGGRDGLYEAVLIEAHERLVSLEELRAIAVDGVEPESQFATLLRTLLGPHPESRNGWAMRVLIKEMLAPTEHIPAMVREAVLPKMQVLRHIVSRVLDLPIDHPGVQRGVLYAVVPSMVFLVSPRAMRDMVFPSIDADSSETVNELISFALAGLKGLRTQHSLK